MIAFGMYALPGSVWNIGNATAVEVVKTVLILVVAELQLPATSGPLGTAIETELSPDNCSMPASFTTLELDTEKTAVELLLSTSNKLFAVELDSTDSAVVPDVFTTSNASPNTVDVPIVSFSEIVVFPVERYATVELTAD